MHEVTLLISITVALTVAFAGGLLARRLGMPTIVGYLVAGVLIGPFTPGFVGDTEDIGQLAKIGVIFLMFGVGIHFSFCDLWSVRTVAVPGAFLQMVMSTAAGFGLSQLWGWDLSWICSASLRRRVERNRLQTDAYSSGSVISTMPRKILRYMAIRTTRMTAAAANAPIRNPRSRWLTYSVSRYHMPISAASRWNSVAKIIGPATRLHISLCDSSLAGSGADPIDLNALCAQPRP